VVHTATTLLDLNINIMLGLQPLSDQHQVWNWNKKGTYALATVERKVNNYMIEYTSTFTHAHAYRETIKLIDFR
jgi:hypothetical protein